MQKNHDNEKSVMELASKMSRINEVKKMNKKAEMPFWLAMTIFVLVGLVLILLFIALLSNKMGGILEYIDRMF